MDLPELHTGELDAPTFAALFDDLERHAEAVEVRIKGDATRHAAEGAVSLREAQQLLASGVVRGVQVRYRWAGEEWTDTLLRSPTSIRVVRMRVMPAPIVSKDTGIC